MAAPEAWAGAPAPIVPNCPSLYTDPFGSRLGGEVVTYQKIASVYVEKV